MKRTSQEIPCPHVKSLAPRSPSLSRCLLKYYLNDGYVVHRVKVLSEYQRVGDVGAESLRKDRAFLRREISRWKSSMERKIAFSIQNVSNAGVNGHVSPERFRGSLEQKYEGTEEIGR